MHVVACHFVYVLQPVRSLCSVYSGLKTAQYEDKTTEILKEHVSQQEYFYWI